MKPSLIFTAVVAPLWLAAVGCNDTGTTRTNSMTTTTGRRTTTTERVGARDDQPAGNVHVDAGPNAGPAEQTTAGADSVNVDVVPGGGVNVDVQGEPLRDRIRERRAARETDLPR